MRKSERGGGGRSQKLRLSSKEKAEAERTLRPILDRSAGWLAYIRHETSGVRSTIDADDVFQDALHRCCRAVARHDAWSPSDLDSYFRRAIASAVIDALRRSRAGKRKARPAPARERGPSESEAQDKSLLEIASEEDSPHRLLANAERARRIAAALDRVSTRVRGAIVREADGGDAPGGRGVSRWQVYRAKLKIRDALKDLLVAIDLTCVLAGLSGVSASMAELFL